jgi:hypothetical protein
MADTPRYQGERGGEQPARARTRNKLLFFTLTVDLLKGLRPTTNLHGVTATVHTDLGTPNPDAHHSKRGGMPLTCPGPIYNAPAFLGTGPIYNAPAFLGTGPIYNAPAFLGAGPIYIAPAFLGALIVSRSVSTQAQDNTKHQHSTPMAQEQRRNGLTFNHCRI